MKEHNKNKAKVPNLRFPGFDGEWETKKLGEVTKWFSGGTPPKDNTSYWNGNIPWISASSMRGVEYSDSELKITEEGLKKGSKLAKRGMLLILVRGSMLFNKIPIGVAIKDIAFNQDVKSIEVNSTLTSYYLLYWMISKEPLIMNMVTGTGIGAGKLDLQDLKALAINLPSLAEQTKIASFLSLIDERIHCQNKIINQLKTLMIESSERLFAKKIRFKNFDQNDFSDWGTKRLKEIGTFFSGGTPSTSKKHYYNGDIPFIKSGEINSNQTEQFISDKGLKESSAKMVNVDDVLYALYGATSGEVGLSKINGAINQAILCIRTDLNNMFLMHYLKLKKGVITKTYLQGGQGNLSAEIIKNLEIPIPCSKEQAKIADLLFLIENKIETEKQILEQYKNQKAYLLQNLFV